MESQTLRIEEAAKLLGIGRTAAYAAIKRGEIPHVKIGGLKLVPKQALEKLLMNDRKAEDTSR